MPKNIVSILLGVGASMVSFIIIMLFFALLLVATDVQTSIVWSFIPYLRAICVMVGAVIAASINGHKGLWQGLTVSGIFLVILAIGRMLLAIDAAWVKDIILFISVGILGGMLGVMKK